MKKQEKSENQIIIYETDDGKAKIEVRFEDENVWLTQKLLGELFGTTTANINMHLKNIFYQNELDENSVIKDFLITAADGKQYKTKHYQEIQRPRSYQNV